MFNRQTLAVATAALCTLSALALVIDRGGLIAWSTLCIGVALVAKITIRPARGDLYYALALAVLPCLVWFGTYRYVIATWETGEVVELHIDTETGAKTARLWVMDIDEETIIYYDAEPDVAASLLAGNPLQLKRRGVESIRVPHARDAQTLSDEQGSRIIEAMTTKYAQRNTATDIYYLLLGRPSDRVGIVATLEEV